MSAAAYVVQATLSLRGECDPAAVGAAVTAELCGHWDHEGPCRWPHNNAIEPSSAPARFRTLFVADPGEAATVRRRIESALRAASGWQVISIADGPVAGTDVALAQRLLGAPRRSE